MVVRGNITSWILNKWSFNNCEQIVRTYLMVTALSGILAVNFWDQTRPRDAIQRDVCLNYVYARQVELIELS